ncbi:hypothetical protein ACSN7S_004634, partial [Enterobacter hormaechei]
MFHYLNETTGKFFLFVAREVNLLATHYHINSVSALRTDAELTSGTEMSPYWNKDYAQPNYRPAPGEGAA